MSKSKIHTFTAKVTPELQEALEALAAAREKYLRTQGVPFTPTYGSTVYYDELCKKEGINMSGEEFKKQIKELYAANEEAIIMNLTNLPDAQLVIHLSDEAHELHGRVSVLCHRIDRGQKNQLTDDLDGVTATLRRLEALRDELVRRGAIKE